MDTNVVLQALDAALPDDQIVADCRAVLKARAASDASSIHVELDDGAVSIPLDAKITLVEKVLFKEYYDITYQTGYRTLVAIGGITQIQHGSAEARYCFATLYHSPGSELLSIDFHTRM